MFGKKKADVLVIGAGPVGLFAALALARQGVRVAVADKQWRTGAHSYALALHPQTLSLLDQLEIKDEVLNKSYPVHTVGLYDGQRRRIQLEIGRQDSPGVPLAVMRQDVLEHTLEEALKRHGVPVWWNHAVARLAPSPNGVEATIDKLVKDSVGYGVARTEWNIASSFDMQVPLVLGADGHHSIARRTLDIEFLETGPARHFAVFECAMDGDLNHEMKLNFSEQTTDVVWPLPDNHCRWSFQLTDFTVPQDSRTKKQLPVEIGGDRFPMLDQQRLHQFLAERAPWFEAEITDIQWRIAVRFEQRMAASFGRDRIWLAGDAGHLTGPAGMQSMNVGMQEAKQLTDIMIDVLGSHDSTEQLAEYDRQRHAEWRQLLGLAGPLTAGPRTDPWAELLTGRLLPCLPASGTALASLVEQMGLQLPTAEAPT